MTTILTVKYSQSNTTDNNSCERSQPGATMHNNTKPLKCLPTGEKGFMQRLFFVLLIIAVSWVTTPLEAQRFSSSSSSTGWIIPYLHRPILEMKILNDGNERLTMYPGSTKELTLVISNTGKKTAENLQLRITNEKPWCTVRFHETEPFFLAAGSRTEKRISINLAENAPPNAWSLLSFFIDEANGYNMTPERNLNVFVGELPPIELIVSDFAIIDQRGVGYFEQFEDVQVTFRIQNCSQNSFSNINARIQLHPTIIPKQLNPVYAIGTLQPGEFHDISAMLSTGIMSDNLGLDIIIEYDNKVHEETFILEFRVDYKEPSKMQAENCLEYMSRMAPEVTETIAYPPMLISASKFAVILSHKDYSYADDIPYASQDALAFAEFLINHMGYPRENIVHLENMVFSEIRNLSNSIGVEMAQRQWRRARGQKELTFYYIGHASVDNHNGDMYLLPSSFFPAIPATRININEVISTLTTWKSRHEFTRVTAFFNTTVMEQSVAGEKRDDQFTHIASQRDYGDIAVFLATSHNQPGVLGAKDNLTYFNQLIMNGLKGEADFNRDSRISTVELYRYLSDEFTGFPQLIWINHRTFASPMFLGPDFFLYQNTGSTQLID